MCVCQHHPYKNSPLWSYTLYTENGRDNFWAFYNDSPLLLYHDWGTIIKVGRPYSFIYWNTKKRANNDGFWKQFQMTLWSLYYYLLIMASLSNSSDYWVHGGAGTYILCRNEWWFRFQRVQGNPGSGTYTALKMELLWEEAGVWSVPDFCGRLVFKTQPAAATQWDRFLFEN